MFIFFCHINLFCRCYFLHFLVTFISYHSILYLNFFKINLKLQNKVTKITKNK